MTDTQAELARARLLRRQCQSAMTSEEADRMFARALQSEREAAAAEARRAALEEAAAVCEQNATRDLKGIILAPELAGKLPDDGDPFAPMLPDNGAAAQVANSVGKVRLHIAAEQIRALATATFDDEHQAAHQDTLRLWQQAKAEIAALTEQQDRTMAALRWAFPLANMAMEGHQQERLRCGHRFGTKRIGLYDKEVQQIEDARRVLASPTPQDDLEGDVKHGNAEYFRAALAHAAAEARRAAIEALRGCPSLDENGYICTKDAAIKAILASPTPQEETR